jgi:hypothetical protein
MIEMFAHKSYQENLGSGKMYPKQIQYGTCINFCEVGCVMICKCLCFPKSGESMTVTKAESFVVGVVSS